MERCKLYLLNIPVPAMVFKRSRHSPCKVLPGHSGGTRPLRWHRPPRVRCPITCRGETAGGNETSSRTSQTRCLVPAIMTQSGRPWTYNGSRIRTDLFDPVL